MVMNPDHPGYSDEGYRNPAFEPCLTCGSRGFDRSRLGPTRCSFCDGTEGGNPPAMKVYDDGTDATLCEDCAKDCRKGGLRVTQREVTYDATLTCDYCHQPIVQAADHEC